MDLNKKVVSATNFLNQTLPKMINVHLDLSNKLKPVMGDAQQVEQIIINLASNSSDAMPDGGNIDY